MEAPLSTLTTLDDARLFALAREGDDAALTCFVERHKDSLVNYLTRLSGSRESAEDLAQETFLRLLERSGRYVEQGKLLPYLFRIATNLVRSDQRKQTRWRLLKPRLVAGNGTSTDPRQQVAVERRELGEILTRALRQLPTRYRIPVVLRDIEDWSYSEIAAVLGVKPGTVKSRLHRGRNSLRRLVAPHWNGDSR